jgi:hypothetical protein
MADDLDDLDGAKGDPQPPQGREPIIVGVGHPTVMAGSACGVEGRQAKRSALP